MNEEKFKKGIEEIRKIGLTESERFQMKSNLDFYIETSTPTLPVRSTWYPNFSFIHIKMYSTAFAVVLIAVTGWGTYSEAIRSLPGDALYPVKVGVIEPLKYTATVDEVAKANLEVANLDTRLKEAEILEVQGKLTEAISNDLQSRISTHSETFNKIVENLSNQNKIQDDSDLKIDFEAKINAHGRVMDSISERDKKGNISRIREIISKKESKTLTQNAVPEMVSAKVMMFSIEDSTVSVSTTTSTTTDEVFGKRKKDTEEIIKSARKNIEKSKRGLRINKKILDDAESLVNDAEKSLQDAERQSQTGDKEGAKQFLIDSRIRAKEANSSIELSQDLSKDED